MTRRRRGRVGTTAVAGAIALIAGGGATQAACLAAVFKPEARKSEGYKVEARKSETFKAESSKAEPHKAEVFKPETYKVERFKSEAYKPEVAAAAPCPSG